MISTRFVHKVLVLDEFQSASLYLFETRQNCIENPAKFSDSYVGDKIDNDFVVVNIVSPTPI